MTKPFYVMLRTISRLTCPIEQGPCICLDPPHRETGLLPCRRSSPKRDLPERVLVRAASTRDLSDPPPLQLPGVQAYARTLTTSRGEAKSAVTELFNVELKT